jgi:hypothetical protein
MRILRSERSERLEGGAVRALPGFHRRRFQARLDLARDVIARCLVRSRMPPVISRLTLATVLAGVLGAPATAEPCNPVIDGTYCATQNVRRSPAPSGGYFAPIQGIARDIAPSWSDPPATLGGITFRGGETCIGLLRRGVCN